MRRAVAPNKSPRRKPGDCWQLSDRTQRTFVKRPAFYFAPNL
jgi:hypothetical protein